MKRRSLSLAVPIALALVAVPAQADAPPDQYRPFVRTDPEVRDAQTGLIWRRAVSASVKFADAAAACPTGTVTYRLPTMKELQTLVDEQPHDEYENGALVRKAIDGSAFPATPAVPFWSGSTGAADPGSAWVVDFASGAATLRDKNELHPVRCVRP